MPFNRGIVGYLSRSGSDTGATRPMASLGRFLSLVVAARVPHPIGPVNLLPIVVGGSILRVDAQNIPPPHVGGAGSWLTAGFSSSEPRERKGDIKPSRPLNISRSKAPRSPPPNRTGPALSR